MGFTWVVCNSISVNLLTYTSKIHGLYIKMDVTMWSQFEAQLMVSTIFSVFHSGNTPCYLGLKLAYWDTELCTLGLKLATLAKLC